MAQASPELETNASTISLGMVVLDAQPQSSTHSTQGSLLSPALRIDWQGEFPVVIDPPAYALVKRAFDILFAVLLLIVSSPLWLVIVTLIKATSPGPIFFRQTRLGRGGRPFTCIKFRSMVNDAELRKIDLLELNEVRGPVFKMRCDPRVTRVGRWLRRFSLDELPQLLNVLAGDMSIVGPRPPVPEEVEQYEPYQRLRLAVKPGLTCIWQVSGRSLIHFDEWVRLDLEYIRRRSFWFDLRLILRTIPAIISGRGAC